MTSYLSIKIATQLKWGVLIYLACKSVTYLSIFEKQKIFAKTIFLKMHFKIGFVAKKNITRRRVTVMKKE